ncbi:GNAT family N-acetyltransferase [Patulibacter americanus]|uniref:GNAT family N-acetyltransferase n=1 Tax=Patulibacter americanus TaxID=588672 RepID=UPI0003B5A507|nr:GNAT family N-acetyltransferase [Patulibacter americanus]
MTTTDRTVPVRVAGIADLGNIVRLVESAYRGEGSRAGWTTEADLLAGQRTDPDMVRALLVSAHDAILVAGDGTEVLGCCTVSVREGRVGFGMFAVRPGTQGGGLGRLLLGEAERYARERWAATQLEMTVIAQRAELIAWYERRGYVRTGETREFPYGDERFGRPLRDDLYLVVLEKQLG